MSETNQVIPKSYVTGLIAKCGFFFAIGLLLTGAILYFSAQQPLGPSYSESFARLAQLKKEMLFKSILIYCILMILTLSGVVFITLIYSHRVVGPLVGLTRITKQLTGGNFSQNAVLRKKDAIKPMADALNSMINSYKNKIISLQADTAEIASIINSSDAEGKLGELTEKGEAIRKTINAISL